MDRYTDLTLHFYVTTKELFKAHLSTIFDWLAKNSVGFPFPKRIQANLTIQKYMETPTVLIKAQWEGEIQGGALQLRPCLTPKQILIM